MACALSDYMKIIDPGWPWKSLTTSTVGYPCESWASCENSLRKYLMSLLFTAPSCNRRSGWVSRWATACASRVDQCRRTANSTRHTRRGSSGWADELGVCTGASSRLISPMLARRRPWRDVVDRNFYRKQAAAAAAAAANDVISIYKPWWRPSVRYVWLSTVIRQSWESSPFYTRHSFKTSGVNQKNMG